MKKIISREVFRNTFILRADYKKKKEKSEWSFLWGRWVKDIGNYNKRERERERERERDREREREI